MSEDLIKAYNFAKHREETEMRLFYQRGGERFFVHSFEEFKKVAEEYNGKAQIYFGVNERNAGKGKNKDVKRITFIPIDIDSNRPDKTDSAATEEELNYALDAGRQIKDWFISQEFEEPAMLKSGNGCYLWCAIPPIDITDDNRVYITLKLRAFQKFIDEKFCGKKNEKGEWVIKPFLPESLAEKITIDSVGDLARIIRVPGTLNIKGKNTPERPYRYCEFLNGGKRNEDARLLRFITSLKTAKAPPKTLDRIICENEEVKKRMELATNDASVSGLLNGDKEVLSRYNSRSEAEMALMNRLVYYELPKEVIWEVMAASKIGKWNEAHEAYKELTYEKAIAKVQNTFSKMPVSSFANETNIVLVKK